MQPSASPSESDIRSNSAEEPTTRAPSECSSFSAATTAVEIVTGSQMKMEKAWMLEETADAEVVSVEVEEKAAATQKAGMVTRSRASRPVKRG